MTPCAKCGAALSEERPGIRAESGVFHVTCAPSELVERASDEYRAIVRKGVRYFVEKYAEEGRSESDTGAEFLRLGRELEAERTRRA
jgi:hypothetical protein